MTSAAALRSRQHSLSGRRRLPGPWATLGFLGQFVAWLVIIAAVVVLVLAVLLPRIVGGQAYTILTGSMRPAMPPGTLVVSRPADPNDLRMGDVITFQLKSGQPEVATHRIVGIGTTMKGERLFTTRGDANDANDVAPVRAVQIRGERWYYVPYVGYLNSFLTGDQRAIGRLVGAGLLGGYALVMFAGSVRDRRREKRAEHEQETEGDERPTGDAEATQ